MVKKWCQGVFGPDQVCLLAHAGVSVCRAYFRHWEWGGGEPKPCPHRVYGPARRKGGVGERRQKEKNEARSLKDKVNGGTYNPTLDSEEGRHI